MEEQKKPERILSKNITQGELLGAILIIIGSLLMFWRTTDVRLSVLEMRMNGTEKINDVILIKLDRVQEGINNVQLTLKDKQDRK